uniref:Uncharacterized protein n=1 Tax=Pipistrellus kuhlii TaxID=59472 RepID=A0A7J7WD69_PIPKU|nr:hypothetical protein mPipKuh1_008002 [Pipistrellus kuhlii]
MNNCVFSKAIVQSNQPMREVTNHRTGTHAYQHNQRTQTVRVRACAGRWEQPGRGQWGKGDLCKSLSNKEFKKNSNNPISKHPALALELQAAWVLSTLRSPPQGKCPSLWKCESPGPLACRTGYLPQTQQEATVQPQGQGSAREVLGAARWFCEARASAKTLGCSPWKLMGTGLC